ncbi:diguanylate cyclase (GGDEF) domain-containing protein [Ferrimonas sediminum]|uniref:diguanylate cyclase n=1 Tax=Ferrimonas sediminum TaxID=718193 RepID=A0A1G8WJI6_9GAMM|nr:GGDEF domain-containing protein [Ferrimonas sediminum]SDJ78512.1 diguanylate cyclase (GGDEF) domain-containing protein [Ferrimonas sediminum]
MHSLDMKTIITVYVLISYACSAMLIVVYTHNKHKFQGLTYLLAWSLSFSVGLNVAALYPVSPPLISTVVSNTLMFASGVFLVFGMARYLGLKLERRIYYIALAIFPFIYFFLVKNQYPIYTRIIFFNGMILPVYLHVAYLIFIKASSQRRKQASIVGQAVMLFLAVIALRIFYSLSDIKSIEYFNIQTPENILVILSMICVIFLTFSLQLMNNSRLYFEVEYLATIDPLTKVYNRRRIEDIVHTQLCNHESDKKSLHLFLIDVDHFKKFNDNYGHINGDSGLVHITNIIKRSIRKCDSVGRWGGEEFVVILPGLTRDEAIKIAARLVKSVCNEKIDLNGRLVEISISLGIATFTKNSSLQSVINQADIALYKAKENGRNRHEVYS